MGEIDSRKKRCGVAKGKAKSVRGGKEGQGKDYTYSGWGSSREKPAKGLRKIGVLKESAERLAEFIEWEKVGKEGIETHKQKGSCR